MLCGKLNNSTASATLKDIWHYLQSITEDTMGCIFYTKFILVNKIYEITGKTFTSEILIGYLTLSEVCGMPLTWWRIQHPSFSSIDRFLQRPEGWYIGAQSIFGDAIDKTQFTLSIKSKSTFGLLLRISGSVNIIESNLYISRKQRDSLGIYLVLWLYFFNFSWYRSRWLGHPYSGIDLRKMTHWIWKTILFHATGPFTM